MAVLPLVCDLSLDPDAKSPAEQKAEIVRRHRIDKAIEMLLSDPIASWSSLEEFELGERDFWHLSYLMDNTVSVSPAISVPTLSEIENLAKRARYVASTEPERLTVADHDQDTGELVEGSFPALHPDYVSTDVFLDDDPLVICIKPGNSPAAQVAEFKLFVYNHALRRSKEGLNPNYLHTRDLADLYVLAYLDLKIWTVWEMTDFYGPSEIASIISNEWISDYIVTKRIAILADQLLDNDSRFSQELLNLAALHRNAQKLSQWPAKRGWPANRKRPKLGST
jgi:hypothetical protein